MLIDRVSGGTVEQRELIAKYMAELGVFDLSAYSDVTIKIVSWKSLRPDWIGSYNCQHRKISIKDSYPDIWKHHRDNFTRGEWSLKCQESDTLNKLGIVDIESSLEFILAHEVGHMLSAYCRLDNGWVTRALNLELVAILPEFFEGITKNGTARFFRQNNKELRTKFGRGAALDEYELVAELYASYKLGKYPSEAAVFVGKFLESRLTSQMRHSQYPA